jgi:hypothetical protein
MGGLLGLTRNQLIRRYFELCGRLCAALHLCAVRDNPTIYRPCPISSPVAAGTPLLRSFPRAKRQFDCHSDASLPRLRTSHFLDPKKNVILLPDRAKVSYRSTSFKAADRSIGIGSTGTFSGTATLPALDRRARRPVPGVYEHSTEASAFLHPSAPCSPALLRYCSGYPQWARAGGGRPQH